MTASAHHPAAQSGRAGVLEDGEHAPPAAQPGRRECAITASVRHCDPAAQQGLGAAATGVIDDGERAPSGSCEPIAMSREMVAKRRGEPKRVTAQRGAGWPAGRRESSRYEGGHGSWRGDRGGRDDQATAQLRQAVGNPSGAMPVPGDGGGAS